MHIHTIQFNIDRLLGGTVHMDATEFGAYMSLLVACYQSKNNLPDDDYRLSRMARCSQKTWKRIKPVIAQKFTIIDGKWCNDVCQKEIERVRSLSTKNKTNVLKRYKTDLPMEDVSYYQKPTNIKNKELRIKKDITKVISKENLKPDNVSQSVWDDFIKLRKDKKAPVTKTVIVRIRGEAEKIGWSLERVMIEMCARGWQGFNSQWIINENQKGKSNESLDDVANRVLARHGIGLEEIPDRSHGETVLFDTGHLRKIQGGLSRFDGGND